MHRSLCALAVLLALSGMCAAQAPPQETVIRLKVQPAAAPRPALKYQLLPELSEMSPGNPIQGYMKCFMEQHQFFHSKEADEKREQWLQMPLHELPVKELRGYGGNALRQADQAARLEHPDWQITGRLRSDGILVLIPEVQEMRVLARSLVVRLRGEVADRRFDDAVVTTKTLFALARHLAEHPTLIGDLVGVAIAHTGVGPLEDMLQQAGCPNLYWAFTHLPAPFVDVRKGMQGERLLLTKELAALDDAAPMSPAQIDRAVKLVRDLVRNAHVKRDQDVGEWFAAKAKDEGHVRAARQRLAQHGLREATLDKFPAGQIVLLDEKRTFEVERDESTKMMGLPYWQAQPLVAKLKRGNLEDSLYAWVVPGASTITKVQLACARIDQRLGLLRCVEALRLYAAENNGKLPAKLSDVGYPLSADPMTGKAFFYRLEGDTAILQGAPPRGHEDVAAYNVRYEVTLVK